MFRIAGIVLSCVWLAACVQRPTFEIPPVQAVPGPLPTDFGGYWERDYSRGADANTELRMLYRGIGPNGSRYPAGQGPSMSARQFGVLSAMAEFADEITRHDVLTIVQDDREVVVQRKDDYSITCSFHGGVANPVDSDYGDEVCVWDAAELVSTLVLPDGLLVRHRFTKSADGERLRVTTTVASQESRTPFTLQRFYRRYVPPASEFNCIETLSMKRVCSTGEIAQ